MLAYSTVGVGANISDEPDFDFIKGEGEILKDVVGPWFGTFFWIFGTVSLVLVALGVVDYVARLVADVLKTLHLRDNDEVERVEDLHRRRVGDVHGRRVRAAVGHGPAARAARARGLPERHRDVRLLVPADQAQPQRPAARDPRRAARASAC